MSKKAKDMKSLLRLNRWTVDERRRELGVLLTRESQLIEEGLRLDREMIAEKEAATLNPITAGFHFGGYAGEHRRRREALESLLAALRGEIEAARDVLAAAYRQLKVYEEVHKERLRQEGIEEAQKEQVVLDEIAQTQHSRKQAAS